MASISETLVNSALTQATGDQAQAGVESMTKLGEYIQDTQVKRQQVEAAQVKLKLNKHSKVMDMLTTGVTKIPKKARPGYLKYVSRTAGELGVPLTPEFIDAFTSPDIDEGTRARYMIQTATTLKRALESGDPQAIEEAQDAAEMLERTYSGQELENFAPLMQKILGSAVSAEGQRARTQDNINAKKAAKEEEFNNIIPKKIREKAAADYVVFTKGGGVDGAKLKINKLKRVINKLRSGEVTTRTLSTLLPFLDDEDAQSKLNPKLKALMDDARGAVELKKQLDSQFSAREAKIIYGRTFDPSLTTEQNIQKIEDLIKQSEAQINSQVQLFDELNIRQRYENKPKARDEAFRKQKAQFVKNIQKFLQLKPESTREELIKTLTNRMNIELAEEIVDSVLKNKGNK